MEDRLVQYPNRVRLVQVDGQPGVYDIEAVPGAVTANGTPLNKATLLSDAVATLVNNAATPNEALKYLAERVQPVKLGGTGANTKMGAKKNFLIGATAVPSFSTKDLADSVVTLIPLANFDVKTDSKFRIGGSGGIVMPYSGTVLVSGSLYIITTNGSAPAGVFIQIIRDGATISVCSNYSVSRGGLTSGAKLINVEAGDILCIYGRGYGSTAKVYATTVKDSFLSVFYV